MAIGYLLVGAVIGTVGMIIISVLYADWKNKKGK